MDRPPLPPRYEPLRLLGRGGGGEVWAVRDRVSGESLALKQLNAGADRSEREALQTEVASLAGLDGLGLPRVLRFGHGADGRSFVVRELVEGESLASLADRGHPLPALLSALADAAVQLAAMHRAGVLHGDIKPGNVLCNAHGRGHLVDLGLAVRFDDDRVRARGFTPHFAAPELRSGMQLSVRTEVYALGASLLDLVQSARSSDAHDAARALAVQATATVPTERPPSADEFARALRALLPPGAAAGDEPVRAWRLVELPELEQSLLQRARALRPGQVLYLAGPQGSGRSTALRRLAWQLGVAEREVAWLHHHTSAEHELELHPQLPADALVLLDDAERDEAQPARLRAARFAQVHVVTPAHLPDDARDVLWMPRLPERDAERLLRQAVPALSERLARYVVERSARRAGALAAAAHQLATATVVSKGDVDRVLAQAEPPADPPTKSPQEAINPLHSALERGRFAEAHAMLSDPRAPQWAQREPFAWRAAEVRIATAFGDFARAEAALAALHAAASADAERMQACLLGARLDLRRGEMHSALGAARTVQTHATGDLAAEAFAVGGMAQLLLGEGERALLALQRAIELSDSPRVAAIAHGSLAIGFERLGREADALSSYTEALQWAERAEDAWTSATTHANLAGLLRRRGDLSAAIAHLEAGIALGERAGAGAVVALARLNLMSLDLHLGRVQRAAEQDAVLARASEPLPSHGHAQWLGLRAELHAREGRLHEARQLFADSADAYRALSRHADALEVELTALLHAAQHRAEPAESLLSRWQQLTVDEPTHQAAREQHPTLWRWTHAVLLQHAGRLREALTESEAALRSAEQRSESELSWQILAQRAQLLEALEQRDAGAEARSLAEQQLEHLASSLPRDLREVFWNEPRRRSVRARTEHPVQRSLEAARSDSPSRHFAASIHADERLLRVLAIARELARERDLSHVLPRVVEHAMALARAERGALLLLRSPELTADDPAQELELFTSQNAPGVPRDEHAYSRSIALAAMQAGEPLVVEDARADARFDQARSVHQRQLQRVVCVPIHGAPPASPVMGALYLESRRPEPPHELLLSTLSAFADQSAITIENARLWQQAERDRAELERQRTQLEEAKQKLEQVLERRTEQLQDTRKDLRRVRRSLDSHFGYHGLIGTSAAMRRVYDFIERLKDTDLPVLILGESGTGKEVVARALHAASHRSAEPFLGINCGAIPANLLESELFGHERGAFTGAERSRHGLLRDAKGGTVLLDELGEMPLAMQPSLLRVLQERTVRPLGGSHEAKVHARILAATNVDLEQMVASGQFREDLYYRVHVATVRLPPLRERTEDIPPLVDALLERFALRYQRERSTLSRDALRALQAHRWPGNIRQLEHVLLNAWLLSDTRELGVEDLALEPHSTPTPHAPSAHRPSADHDAALRERIERALQAHGGNRLRAAEALGMPRRTFYRRLKDFGLLA